MIRAHPPILILLAGGPADRLARAATRGATGLAAAAATMPALSPLN